MNGLRERIIYGAMGIGGSWNREGVTQQELDKGIEALKKAYEIGIRKFDHADIYTMGKSEYVFGEFMKRENIKREDIFIQTKVGIILPENGKSGRYDFSKEHILREVDGSLKRLNVKYVDRLLLHRPDHLFNIEEIKEAVDKLFEDGKIKDIGVSNMSKGQMKIFEKALGRKISTNQLEISLKRCDFFNNWVDFNTDRLVESYLNGTVEYCMVNEVEVQAWGAMAGGIFTGKAVDEEEQCIKDAAEIIARIAEEKKTTRECVLLAWILKHPANISPIIGTTNVNRIENIRDCMKTELTKEEWYEIFEARRGYSIP